MKSLGLDPSSLETGSSWTSFFVSASEAKVGLTGTVIGLSLGMMHS